MGEPKANSPDDPQADTRITARGGVFAGAPPAVPLPPAAPGTHAHDPRRGTAVRRPPPWLRPLCGCAGAVLGALAGPIMTGLVMYLIYGLGGLYGDAKVLIDIFGRWSCGTSLALAAFGLVLGLVLCPTTAGGGQAD